MSRNNFNIEQVYQAGDERPCEDQLVAGRDIFGVFDGASSLDGALFDGRTGAWWASYLASQEFSKNDKPLFEMAVRANERLKSAMNVAGVCPQNRLSCWSTSAAAICLNDDQVQWSQIGDCHILAIDEDGRFELLNTYHNHDRETLMHLKDLIDQGVSDFHQALRPQIEAVRWGMNCDYGVINGDESAFDFFEHGSRPLSGIKHLLLVTDGLMPPSEDPAEDHDFQWIADLYLEGGLALVQQKVRELEQADPDCRRYPRFKPHDDIAGIALSFT